MNSEKITDVEGLVKKAKLEVKMDDAMTARLLGALYNPRKKSIWWRVGSVAAGIIMVLGGWSLYLTTDTEQGGAVTQGKLDEEHRGVLNGGSPILKVKLEQLGKSCEYPFIMIGDGYYRGEYAEYHIDPLYSYSISLKDCVL